MKFRVGFYRSFVRQYSRHIVYRTEANNPFQNLALEEWLYENVNLSSTSCLFIWRSLPSVIIGRHQNPWAECCVRLLKEKDVFLARRQSGGGTVYHDTGNINLSFFTSRKLYDRRRNLDIIVNALTKRWNDINLTVNCRDDILLDEKYKISGSAAKLGKNNAYHHCTLLFNTDLDNMGQYLQPSVPNVITKATQSVRSQTKNISDYVSDISYEAICEALTSEYFANNGNLDENVVADIDPMDENMFPKVSDIVSKLQSWDWLYGKSSKFEAKWSYNSSNFGDMVILISVTNGIIDDVNWIFDTNYHDILMQLSKLLVGSKFQGDNINLIWKRFMKETKPHFPDHDFINHLDALIRRVVELL